LAHRERLISDLVATQVVEAETLSRSNALKICRAIIHRFASTLQDGSAEIDASDFERAIKIELLLRGRATERMEVIAAPAFAAMVERLIAVVEREVKDPTLRARLALGFQEAATGSIQADEAMSANA